MVRYLLWPFSMAYGWVVRLRNWLFDQQVLPSKGFEVPVIGIGNLSAGGTGKTPMAEYVLKLLLKNGYQPALLSRGYKRKTKGYEVVKPLSSAEHVGDEPNQIKRKFPEVAVAVCEDRVTGIERLLHDFPQIDVIVLDDSFQHRKLKAGFNILLTSHSKPYFTDRMLPSGMLREPAGGHTRADVIILTKCPVLPEEAEKKRLRSRLKPLPHQEVYFTGISYRSLTQVQPGLREEVRFPIDNLRGYRGILFTGIANSDPLVRYLRSREIELTELRFGDHHAFNDSDMRKIITHWQRIEGRNKLLLTTEKDWRRLEHTAQARALEGLPIYYLPIEVEWDEKEKRSFDEKILSYVRAGQGSR